MRTLTLFGLLFLIVGLTVSEGVYADEQPAKPPAAEKAGPEEAPQAPGPGREHPGFGGIPGGRFGHPGRSGDGSDFWGDKDLHEMVSTIMVVRLSRELELNDEQTIILHRHIQELRDEMMRVGKARYEALKALKEAIDANAADDVLRKQLENVMELDLKRAELRQAAFEKAANGLTVRQQAKLYYFVQEFEGQMRRMIQRVMESGADRLMQWRSDQRGEPSKDDSAAREALMQRVREEMKRHEAAKQGGGADSAESKAAGE